MGEEKGGSRKDWGAYRYIRKPYEVAAIKWTGKNPEEVVEFLDGDADRDIGYGHIYGNDFSMYLTYKGRYRLTLRLHGLNEQFTVDEGFYIVENPDATYAVNSPEKFHALYEPVLDTELRTVIERMYESMVKGEECIKG